MSRPVLAAWLAAGLAVAAACASSGVGPSRSPQSPSPAPAWPDARGQWRIDLLAACEFPAAADRSPSDPARVGGLSGLAFEPDTGTWLAVSDEPRLPRLYRFELHVENDACRPELIEVIALRRATEATRMRRARDFEDLVRLPDGSLLLVSESDEGEGTGSPVSAPGLHHASVSGEVLRSYRVPGHVVPTGGAGVRDNAAFESVAVTPDGGRAFVAVEQPLLQDDEVATFARGAVSRLLEFRREGDQYVPAREFALPVDPVPHPRDIQPERADIGVVALIALDESTLLMLERSFVRGARAGLRASRNEILLSRLVLDDVDDVAGMASLRGALVRPVLKQRLLSLADLGASLPPWLLGLDNFEGMAFGPRLADGSATLVLVSDDNFNAAQRTAFVILRVR